MKLIKLKQWKGLRLTTDINVKNVSINLTEHDDRFKQPFNLWGRMTRYKQSTLHIDQHGNLVFFNLIEAEYIIQVQHSIK